MVEITIKTKVKGEPNQEDFESFKTPLQATVFLGKFLKDLFKTLIARDWSNISINLKNKKGDD